MGFSYKNSKGTVYYLHQKGTLMYFSKKEDENIELPSGYAVVENFRTGLPLLKKKE